MMSRPCASSARARTSTSKAVSVPNRAMDFASFMGKLNLGSFLIERNAVAVLEEIDRIADLHTVARDASREPAAAIERDDHQLIRCVRRELLWCCVDDGLGVNETTARGVRW